MEVIKNVKSLMNNKYLLGHSLKKKPNLRFKGLVDFKSEGCYYYSPFWSFFFLKKACKVVESVVANRGIIYFIVLSKDPRLQEIKLLKRHCFVICNQPNPGFLSNLHSVRGTKMFPDLVIYLKDGTDSSDSLLKEAENLQIPVIASVARSESIHVSFPIIINNNFNQIVYFFYKSILKGLALEKKQFSYGKKK